MKFPIVKSSFKKKDGNVYISDMMVNAGFVNYMLNRYVFSLINELCAVDGKSMNIVPYRVRTISVKGIILFQDKK